MPRARVLFVVLAVGWVALLVTAPYAALGGPASGLVYALSSFICHQRPERSFHLSGAQLPVCARCFGLYLGAAIASVAALNARARRSLAWREGRWSGASALRTARAAIALGALPTLFTWAAEVSGVWSPSNLTRFTAALPLGAAVALTVNLVGCARRRPNTSRAPRTPI